MIVPEYIEELLEDLAESLQIPPGRYDTAERSYKSVGEWLHRDNSRVRDADPQVYIQGSFRLGTVIRPASDEDDYDVDLVCELSLSKTRYTQSELKAALGYELKLYAEAHQMGRPEEGRRCWTQSYADSAQFHMDTLPAIPDAMGKRLLLEKSGYSTEWSETAIAITDRDHPRFRQISEDWPHSNPKGYSKWFRSCTAVIFDQRRRAMALETHANVEDIPEYKVRTPLQSAIQILKRHRDMMFADRPDDKPISIILTTLASHSYQQEPTIAAALYSILQRMDNYIENRYGIDWITNPTDPVENFADRWQSYPQRRVAFYEWLTQARKDFADAARASSRETASTILLPRFGTRLIEDTLSRKRRNIDRSTLTHVLVGASGIGKVINPVHRKTPPWNAVPQGEVNISRATIQINGFRPKEFINDDRPLSKHGSLRFHADTNVPKPYKARYAPQRITGFHRIRHYGLIANTQRKENLIKARALLQVPETASAEDNEADKTHDGELNSTYVCPDCGAPMIIIETFMRGQQPRAPPLKTDRSLCA